MFKFKNYNFKQYGYSLLILVLILGGIGAYLIGLVQAADSNLAQRQVMGLAIGFFAAVFVSLVDYHFICRLFIPMYLFNIILLLMVKYSPFAVDHYDARRWLKFGSIEFQPSELSKIIMILFLAQFFSLFQRSINRLPTFIGACVLMAIPTYIIFDQPHLSTTMVMLFIFAVLYFAAGLSYKIIVPILLIGIPLFIGLFWYIQQDFQTLLTEYQQDRILSILNPDDYPDLVYQQSNSVQAIGSGQLYGKVLNGEADVLGSSYVPVVESDFIFSAVGEAFGFFGSCVVIGLLTLIIIQCLVVAKNASDYLGMLIATGISSMFMIQLFVNVGVATQILPNTGTPFPFLSSGLSSLLSGMLSVGVILNIKLQSKKRGGNSI